MLRDAQGCPRKTREMHNHHMDSTVWNDFAFRDDDVVIGTYGKSGTTWVQQIVGQLIFGGDPEVPVAELSPWLDLRIPPKEVKLPAIEAQRHRRFLKTHLPVDALVWSPRARYIYVGRDGRDVMWSMHNHFHNANELLYQLLNDTPGRVGPAIDRPPADPRPWFLHWLQNDGAPFWPFWDNIRSWWEVRDQPNLLMLHFAELKADLPGQIRRIADFLGIAIHPGAWPDIQRHCSFDWMKAHGSRSVPLGGALWEGGAQTFVHKGTNGRWRDSLTEAECRQYETMARARLGEDCAQWLATGAMPAPARAVRAA